nr:MAG: hypothetical protein [Apis mellifra filamentous-like virus]
MSLRNPFRKAQKPLQTKVRAIYDEHRVLWDLLRYHRYLVDFQQVKQIVAPNTLFANNYMSTERTCQVNLSPLQNIPWLALYATPDNSIILDRNAFIAPEGNNEDWLLDQDDVVMDYGATGINYRVVNPVTKKPEQKVRYENDYEKIQPISNIRFNEPDYVTLNFNERANVNVRAPEIQAPPSKVSGNYNALCQREVNLVLTKTTPSNLGAPNVDSDQRKFDRRNGEERRRRNLPEAEFEDDQLRKRQRVLPGQRRPLNKAWEQYLQAV